MTLIFNTRPAMVMNHARAKKSSSKIRWCNSYEWKQSDWRTKKRTGPIFTALRCVSAVYAVVVCLSVCPSVRPSVTSRYCIETTGEIELFWAWSLPSTHSTLCYKEIWVSPKIRPKLRTWKISIALSRKIVVVDVTVLRRFPAYIGGGVATNTVVSVPSLSYDWRPWELGAGGICAVQRQSVSTPDTVISQVCYVGSLRSHRGVDCDSPRYLRVC